MIELKKVYEISSYWFDDRNRLHSALMDLYPQEVLEINSLMVIYDSGILSQIRSCEYIDDIKIEMWITKIQQEYGLEKKIIKESINNWIRCFEKEYLEKEDYNQGINNNNDSIDNTKFKNNELSEIPIDECICRVCGNELIDLICPVCGWKYTKKENRDSYNNIKYVTKSLGSNKVEITDIYINDSISDYYIPEIIIPQEINNCLVVSIGNKAFQHCLNVASVIIPNSVIKLGEKIFQNCVRLKHVILPESLKVIPPKAFNFCIRLEEITIPNTVEEIGDEAFKSCRSLVKIYGMENVAKIGCYSFQKCEALNEFILPKTLSYIGCGAFKECNLLCKFTFNQILECVSDEMFMGCTKVLELIMPLNIKTIGQRAFMNCFELNKIILPGSVKRIGEDAFLSCINLRDVYILNDKCNIEKHAFDYVKEGEKNDTQVRWPVHKLDGSPDYRYNPIITPNKQKQPLKFPLRNLTIHCNKDSSITDYAVRHHFKVEYI